MGIHPIKVISIREKTLTIPTSTNGVPASIAERDKDGTTRTFSLYNSTWQFRLSALKDRNGNTVTYTRDSSGNLTKAVDVHGRSLSVSYGNGLATTLTDSAGRSTSYGYDSLGRKTSESGPQGATSYVYNALNKLTQVTYPNGSIHEYTYDAQGRVVGEDDGGGVNKIAYTYGPTGTST